MLLEFNGPAQVLLCFIQLIGQQSDGAGARENMDVVRLRSERFGIALRCFYKLPGPEQIIGISLA
jgi:hypothetical protein